MKSGVDPKDLFHPHLSGKEPSAGTPTIVFLCGYPDTVNAWSKLAPQFEGTHHVVKLAMPDYESPRLRSFWGYGMKEMADGLAAVIEPHVKRGSTIHLVGHDWGALICMIYATLYGQTLSKLVLLDVGMNEDTPSLIQLSYMLWLAISFLVSRVSDALATAFIRLYPWAWFGPLYMDENTPIDMDFKSVRGFMSYPYLRCLLEPPTITFPGESIPVLYLYGGHKRTMYHSQKYLDQLEKTPRCGHMEFETCGHWLHWQQPDKVGRVINEFLKGI